VDKCLHVLLQLRTETFYWLKVGGLRRQPNVVNAVGIHVPVAPMVLVAGFVAQDDAGVGLPLPRHPRDLRVNPIMKTM